MSSASPSTAAVAVLVGASTPTLADEVAETALVGAVEGILADCRTRVAGQRYIDGVNGAPTLTAREQTIAFHWRSR